ncbi:MAG: hypothetical protein JW735_09980 [Prolixibacteraceae bacterium]|nr:hypothetical protein [Prolixibacteraceae bacterium]
MKILRRTAGIVVLVILFLGCNNNNITQLYDTQENEFELVSNELLRIDNNLIIKLLSVSDKRCPIGVVCDHSGNVDLGLEMYYNGEFKNIELSYNKSITGLSVDFEGYNLSVVEVMPYLYNNEQVIDLADYKIYIKVTTTN